MLINNVYRYSYLAPLYERYAVATDIWYFPSVNSEYIFLMKGYWNMKDRFYLALMYLIPMLLKIIELDEIKIRSGNPGHMATVTKKAAKKRKKDCYYLHCGWLIRNKCLRIIFLFCCQMAIAFPSTSSW